MIHCTICNKEVEIKIPGSFSDVLECGHIKIKTSVSTAAKSGATGTEAVEIAEKLNISRELPKISSNELVNRVIAGLNDSYEEFFQAENPQIEDMVNEHGKDNAALIFTAIHAHLSKVLLSTHRFKNLYFIKIEQLRKEIEDKAVKELIQSHDFAMENIVPKPKKQNRIVDKVLAGKDKTSIDKAKEGLAGLLDKDGKPVDVMKVMANLMWKKTDKDKEKEEYKKGLDNIKAEVKEKVEESK